ncbi:hypothetical protein [Cystobacter fuscus]
MSIYAGVGTQSVSASVRDYDYCMHGSYGGGSLYRHAHHEDDGPHELRQ